MRKRPKRICWLAPARLALLGLLLGWATRSPAQTAPPADSLGRRLHRVEQRLDTLGQRLAETAQQVQQQTRSSIENAQNGRFVIKGLLPDTYLTLGGFVQADIIYSLRPLGQETALMPASIPVPNGRTASASFSPRPSRFYFRSLTKTAQGHVFKAWLEFDLFNPDGSTTPRLRHAWAELGPLGVGQTWSLFMDPDAFPNIIEYNAPNAMMQLRQMQLRYTPRLGKNVRAAVSLEQPESQLRFADSTGRRTARGVYPDLVGMLRLGAAPRRYLRLAALLHPLTYHDARPDQLTTCLGWGLSLTGGLGVGSRDQLTFQAAYGRGLERYINDLNTAGYDGFLPRAGPLRAIPAAAGYTFYDHWWAARWSTSLGWGYVRLSPVADQPATAFHTSNYGIANLLFVPFDFFKVGVEYQYGAQQLANQQRGAGSRLQCTVQSQF